MADLRRDFWIRETATGQQVGQLHDIYDDDDDNTSHTLQKEDNLIKQKNMTQETATQNIRKRLQPSIPNKKAELRYQCMDNSTTTLKNHQ